MTNDQHASAQGEPSAEDAGTAIDDEFSQALSDLARTLQAEDDPDQVLEEIVRAAVDLVPGAEEGSISLVTGRRDISTEHPTSDLPLRVDALQMETGEGPCLDAVYEEQTVRAPDLAHEERWPKFARKAAEAGAGSILSFQLYVEGDNLGALNLYSRRPNAFDDESEQLGLLVAAHAAIAFSDAREIRDLHRALDTRDLIGQAKGILMERYKITAEQAFTLLVRASQNSNLKLRDMAEELASTGELAASPRRVTGGRPSRSARS